MADRTVYQIQLQQCAQGQVTALEQLYDQEAPYLLALSTSLLHRSSDAEALLKESFGLIWRHADSYNPELGSARAWIYSILRFRAQQRLKKIPTLSPFIKTQARLLIPSDAPNDLQLFQHVDDQARKMLSLAYLHAYSYAEIAKECQSTIDHTQQHIDQALIQLTRIFSGWRCPTDDSLKLLGNYCLGLLRDELSLETIQSLLATELSAAQDLLRWEEIFSALTYSLSIVKPAPKHLLSQILQDLNLTPSTPAPATESISASLAQVLNQSTPSRFDTAVLDDPAEKNVTAFTADTVITAPAQNTSTEPTNPSPATQHQTKIDPIPTDTKSVPTPPHNKKPYWLWAVIGGLIVAVMIWFFIPKGPTIQMVQMGPQAGAILQAPGQSSTPGWIVSVDPEGHVLLTPQVHTEIQSDQAVQLWTQSPNSTQIRSLGLINPNQPITLPVDLIGEVQVGQIFEMTLEPSTGAQEPTGAVLFIGRIVKFGDIPQQPTPTNT